MRNLSYWARRHPAYARIIIIISRCFLFWIAYFLGTQLSRSDADLSPVWIYFFIGVFFIAGATYPSKRSSNNYVKRKLYDCIVACCGFFIVLSLVSQLNKPVTIYETAQATAFTTSSPYKYAEAKKLLEQFQKGEKTKFTAKEKRIIKNEFKYQIVQYAKAKITGNKASGANAALIILTCIAAVGLLFLVLSLACTLSCNGSDAAAVVVGILGTVAVVWGAVALIRRIKRKQSGVKSNPSQ